MSQRVPRTAVVKNKTPAPIQITAEQILREAQERQESETAVPKQKITDKEELDEFRLRKRKTYEDSISKNRYAMGTWIRYAHWEESQKEFRRARSIFERAIDIDYTNVSLWLKYAEMEMRNKFINHARNVWDRAVTLLPRVDQLWFKYIHMEEMLGNVAGARAIFERWMTWEPDAHAWMSYVKLELRYHEVDRARRIFERYVRVHPSVTSWLKFAHFEEKHKEIDRARKVFETAADELGDAANDEKFYVAFAKFEERAKDIERARAIYKYALDHIPKQHAEELYATYMAFEKQFGDRAGIEDAVIGKKRFQYEEELKANSHNYDVWFDYIHLEEANGDVERIREVYERAIANIPPVQEKRFWRRYIYLWINYALYEELEAKDIERAREVYKACIKLIPHKIFSFSKIWIMHAHFEIRQKNLANARSILGHAIGIAPKDKLFKAYIKLESDLVNVDRCRILYQKYLEYNPANCNAWIQFAEFEKGLEEYERVRAIYELAVNQPVLDMPEVLWKSYIDFEIFMEDFHRVRDLYERLLSRTKHVKVWISYALFEHTIAKNKDAARAVFERAYKEIKANAEQKEDRVMLLESWKRFEQKVGEEEPLKRVLEKQPKRVIKKRLITTGDGGAAGYEEYYDYIFPDDAAAAPNLKILEMAQRWKKAKLASGSSAQ